MQPPPIGRALLSLSPSEASIPSARILSDTAPKAHLADIPQDLLQRLLYEGQGTIEARRASPKVTRDHPLWRAAHLSIQEHAKKHSLRFLTVLTDRTAELGLAADIDHYLLHPSAQAESILLDSKPLSDLLEGGGNGGANPRGLARSVN